MSKELNGLLHNAFSAGHWNQNNNVGAAFDAWLKWKASTEEYTRFVRPEAKMSPDRVSFTDKGTLDEVFSSRGAHLERLSTNGWFLIFYHEDGSDTALWFKSRDLVKPFWETRPAPAKGENHEP